MVSLITKLEYHSCYCLYKLHCIFNASFYMNIESDAPGYFALSFVVAHYPGKED